MHNSALPALGVLVPAGLDVAVACFTWERSNLLAEGLFECRQVWEGGHIRACIREGIREQSTNRGQILE